MTTLDDCRKLDAQDPLRTLRDHFEIAPGIIYLDGNSLGAMPKGAVDRAVEVVSRQWGDGLITSWNTAGWFDLPQRLGDQIAALIGAGTGEVVVTDTTSVNLYKVMSAALRISAADHPDRRLVVSERSNFPTDLYIAENLCKELGFKLQLVESEQELAQSINCDLAVLMLTHVNYRTGAMYDMAAVTASAQASGALVVWDLAHSAGAVAVHLKAANADFAIGCTYKYLNGGPGSPAFVWVNPRHVDRFWQPLSGWWGHAAPFEFAPGYEPAKGVARYLCGTQPIVSMSLLECGLQIYQASAAFGGMPALRAKSLALTDLFIDLVHQRCAKHNMRVVTPVDHARRGSQVSLEGGDETDRNFSYAVIQALIARGVIGDFRAGDGKRLHDIMRFGFTPLYLGYEDVWNAVEHLRDVLDSGEWKQPQFRQKNAVT